MKSGFAAAILAAFALSSAGGETGGDPNAGETPARRDERMAWWREAKFGMFIHWGVYAVPAGIYRDKQIGGGGEWIMLRGQIPVAEYRGYARAFNPVKYQPAEWAKLARNAGMRYMVITSKHHDGFALFPSEACKWDIADATPYAKDLIGPLAAAARAEGLKFGLYYSQAQDWVNPGGAKAGLKPGEGWDEAHKGSFDDYIRNVAVPQVREILTRYQPDVLWWDTPRWMTPAQAAPLAELIPLRPGLITNNRLYKKGADIYQGDIDTPEQEIPATGIPGRDWETCMTMNHTWGFKSYDKDWKSTEILVRNLVDIVSKGGNYLLNVGPTAEGLIPEESVQRLNEIGAWMKTNGEAIHGTRASVFSKLPWGRCTIKPAGDNTILYLHVFDWPADGKLLVPGLDNPIQSAEVLAGGAKVAHTPSPAGPVLTLPSSAPDKISSTIKLVVTGKPGVSDPVDTAGADGVIRLLPATAVLEGRGIRTEIQSDVSNIGFWTDPKDAVSWNLIAPKDGKYTIQIEVSTPHEGSVIQIAGIGKLACSVPPTGSFDSYQTTRVGEVSLAGNARARLTLRAVADAWKPVNIRKVELVPVP